MRHYYANTDGVVFVVDSTDRERADETKELLYEMIAEDELRGVPLLVMANKQDNLKARSKEVIAEELKLRNITDREWSKLNDEILMLSAIYNSLSGGGSRGGGGPPGGQPPPPLLGDPQTLKRGKNVACMRTNTPHFST